MLAALPKSFKKSLPHRRDGDFELPCPVIDNGSRDGRLIWRYVLDDLQRPDPSTLIAFPADEQATLSRWCEQSGAGCREIRLWIKIMRNPYRIPQNNCIYVCVGIDINAAHKLNKFPSLSLVVSAGLVEVFADEIEQYYNFHALEIRDS